MMWAYVSDYSPLGIAHMHRLKTFFQHSDLLFAEHTSLPFTYPFHYAGRRPPTLQMISVILYPRVDPEMNQYTVNYYCWIHVVVDLTTTNLGEKNNDKMPNNFKNFVPSSNFFKELVRRSESPISDGWMYRSAILWSMQGVFNGDKSLSSVFGYLYMRHTKLESCCHTL